MAMADKSNHLAVIENEVYLKMGKEHTSKDRKITLDEAMDLAKKNDRHTPMLLKMFNMGQNVKEKKERNQSHQQKK